MPVQTKSPTLAVVSTNTTVPLRRSQVTGEFAMQIDGDIWVMNADGSDITRLTRMPGAQSPEAWMSDGRIPVADWSANQKTPDWFVMAADGTGVAAVSQLKGVSSPVSGRP